MRSGISQQQRTPTTDFVQDYAAKRQAQLERAKKIREERVQHLTPRDAGGNSSNASTNNNNYGHIGSLKSFPNVPPAIPAARPTPLNQPLSPSPCVLRVAEEDFKQATKAGIITPDQARQLWAMLSNQLIRVMSASANSFSSGPPAISVDSLLALSAQTFSGSDKKQVPENEANRDSAKFAFTKSISMESLRQSIAHFKEQQRRMGGSKNAGNYRRSPLQQPEASRTQHHQTEEQHVSPTELHQRYYDEECASEDNYDEDDRESKRRSSNHVNDTYDQPQRGAAAMGKGKKAAGQRKPSWNFDINVDLEAGSAVQSGSPQAPPPSLPVVTRTMKKKLKLNASANSAASPVMSLQLGANADKDSSGAFRPQQHTGHGDREGEQAEDTRAKGFALSRASNKAGGGTRGRLLNASPANPSSSGVTINFDDIPVGTANMHSSNVMDVFQPEVSPLLKAGKKARVLSNTCASPSLRTNVAGLDACNQQIILEDNATAQEPLRECATCGRSFRLSVLARHEPLCRKQARKSRKVFDVKGMRLQGIEGIDQVFYSSPVSTGHSKKLGNDNKIPKWKIQHEQFQAAMKAMHQPKLAHGGGKASLNGGGFGNGPLPPPPMTLPEELDDRVPCPHCGRKFAEDVATRHIPKCANTIAKPKGIRPIRR